MPAEDEMISKDYIKQLSEILETVSTQEAMEIAEFTGIFTKAELMLIMLEKLRQEERANARR